MLLPPSSASKRKNAPKISCTVAALSQGLLSLLPLGLTRRGLCTDTSLGKTLLDLLCFPCVVLFKENLFKKMEALFQLCFGVGEDLLECCWMKLYLHFPLGSSSALS